MVKEFVDQALNNENKGKLVNALLVILIVVLGYVVLEIKNDLREANRQLHSIQITLSERSRDVIEVNENRKKTEHLQVQLNQLRDRITHLEFRMNMPKVIEQFKEYPQ